MVLIKVSILLIAILLYALMSTCDPMWFKIFINWYQSHIWMTFKLHIQVILGFPFSSLEAIFLGFFFRLVLILGFQAQLMLETCRKHCLEQSPSFFCFCFWSSFDGISKLGFVMVLPFMRFLCNFWVQIEGLMFEDGNLIVFIENCTKKFGQIFFFLFQKNQIVFNLVEKMMTS